MSDLGALLSQLPTARVIVLSRDGCHLCETAENIVDTVCRDIGIGWARIDIDQQHEALRDRYTAEVPVTFVDGAQHDMWRVDEQRLRARLTRGVG